MTLHDRFARLTPYEIAVPGRAFAEERFGAVREEAEERGADSWEPGSFVMLAQVGRMVHDVRGEEDAPALIHQYGMILYHAFQFWAAGEALYLLDVPAARRLVAEAPAADWTPRAPVASGYVQLPHRLFWATPDPDGPPEAIDGLFWAVTPGRRLHVMVVLGIHRARPGFSVIPVPGVALDEAGGVAAGGARERGDDFASGLPGSELDELHALETHGEALSLCARFFHHVERRPEAVGDARRAGPEEETPDTPRRSTLEYRIVGAGEGP